MTNDQESCECTNNRWSHWFGTLVFSIVALVSLTTSWADDLNDQSAEGKWVFSAILIALLLSGLAVLAHGARVKFIGTSIEAGLAFIVMVIMAVALPAIMKPDNAIAVNTNGAIQNANLYFFSWGAFFTALFAFVHIMQNVYKVGAGGTKNTQFTSSPWVLLIATSLIVMSSSARIFKSRDCQNLASNTCSRLKYVFSLGVISGVLSFIWLFVAARCHMMVDTCLCVIMLVLWCLAVAYTTFGGDAPASNIGNLYLSSWISFVICCRLTSVAIHSTVTFMTKSKGGDSAKAAEEVAPEEAEVKDEDQNMEEDKDKDDKAAGDDEETGGASGEEHPA